MQELAAKLKPRLQHAGLVWDGLTHHPGIAKQLQLGGIAIDERPTGSGEGQLTCIVIGTDAHAINLQCVDIRVMTRLRTDYFRFQAATSVVSFDRKLVHQVIGLVAHGR